MRCGHCQNELPDNARFCTKCGIAVTSSGAARVQEPEKVKHEILEAGGTLLGCFAWLVILAILIGGVWLLISALRWLWDHPLF